MNRLKNCVLILELLEKLKDKGSWCGETHIQKASYFLKTLADVPMDFDFLLYKHGPFSFELRDELTAMRADGLLSLQSKFPYGPTLVITDQGRDLLKKFPVTLKKYKTNIDFVADKLGSRGVADLEKLATALYVIKEESSSTTKEQYIARINEIKPHVTLQEAENAVEKVQNIMDEFTKSVYRLTLDVVVERL